MSNPRASKVLEASVSRGLLWAYRRPAAFLAGLVFLPIACLVAVTYQSSVVLWREQTLHNLRVTARLGSEIVAETLGDTLRLERMLATEPGFVEAVERRDRAYLARRFHELLRVLPRVDLMMAIAADGEVVASHPDRGGSPARTVAQEEPFLGAQRRGWHPYVSAVYLREGPEAEKVVGVVLPVAEDDRVVGVLQAQHRVETVKSWLQKLRVEPGGFLYVVDHHDQLVVFPFQVLSGQPKVVSQWPPVALPLSPDGGTLIFDDRRSRQRWLAGVYPVEAIGWRVVAVQPEREALQTLRRVFWALGLLLALVTGLAAVVIVRWARLHAFSLEVMRQNAKLLKQQQQRRLLERGGES